MLKMASKWISNSSPLGLILAGTAIIATAPMLKNAVRGVAVTATRGVLSIAEGAATLGEDVREGWEDLVAEAKSKKAATAAMAGGGSMDMGTVVGAGAGGAIGASIGGTMAGATGAVVGSGLGSVVGAGLGGGMTEDHSSAAHKDHGPAEKAPKNKKE